MSRYSIQLFPLETVLFPHCDLPLHIFEPRYRTLIRMCLEHDAPFGIVRIVAGSEIGEPAYTVSVGTMTRISKVVELDDGRMFITTHGEQRFQIIDSTYDEDCMTAIVEPYEDENEPSYAGDIQHFADEVRRLFLNYWKLLRMVSKRDIGALDLPHDPEVLSWLIPSVLHVPTEIKQALLESQHIRERLELEQTLLIEEIEKMLEVMRGVRGN